MAHELYQRIGRRIREARHGRFSQTELAEHLGYSQGAMSKFELGLRTISLPDLLRISKILEKPLTYFIEDETEQTATLQSAYDFKSQIQKLNLSLIPLFHTDSTDHVVREQATQYITMPDHILRGADLAIRVSTPPPPEVDVRQGDIVLVQRQHEARWGHIIVLQTKDGFTFHNYIPDIMQQLDNSDQFIGRVVRLIRDM